VDDDQRPHIVFILMDDLGRDDTGIYGNARAETDTPNITALAKDGITLGQHYVFFHCSPTRRSFLTGRSPLHCGEQLSKPDSDDINLRYTWISQKLQTAGYVSHWYGKGHTGYKSIDHMPFRHGFNSSVIFLPGGGSYFNMSHWSEGSPLPQNDTYSTEYFSSLAFEALREHDPAVPLFMYLPFQAPHFPYEFPPDTPAEECVNNTIGCMMRSADMWIGRLVTLLREKGMYDKTLIVWSSDNGGARDGNNFPLRGGKQSNYQGGFQAAAFVSGGFLPTSVRGTTNNNVFHIMDWYPTLCRLAGVDGSDDPEVPPLPIDPSMPDQDVYQGNLSFPPVDGVDIWDQLLLANDTAPHASLWLSSQAMIRGRHKIVVAPPNSDIVNSTAPRFSRAGWRSRDGVWEDAADSDWPCQRSTDRFQPCLFDLLADPREQMDLAQAMPSLVADMWEELNRSNLGAFQSRSPAALLGPCNFDCALSVWDSFNLSGDHSPYCGVLGCDLSDSMYAGMRARGETAPSNIR